MVLPSGVSYSADTVDKIMSVSTKLGTRPACPQSGMPIDAVVPNQVTHALQCVSARFV